MSSTASQTDERQKSSGRLHRGSLNRELIIDAALRLLDDGGEPALTFSRLGKELGASPTAVYRHFSSRDEIVNEVADHLIGLSLDGYSPAESWKDSLRDLAFRAWNTFGEHPAAAMMTFYRLTLGPNEMRAVNHILAAMHQAGLEGRLAVTHYQAFSNLVLASSGTHAARIAMLNESNAQGEIEWHQEYRPANPQDYPYVAEARVHFESVEFRDYYSMQVEAMLEYLQRALPHND